MGKLISSLNVNILSASPFEICDLEYSDFGSYSHLRDVFTGRGMQNRGMFIFFRIDVRIR
jgi:hypothetical protein